MTNNLEKDFVPYQESLELKELDFDEPCFGTYDEDENFELQDFFQTYETFPSHIVAAPTFSQAFRFFRKVQGLHSYIDGAHPWFRYYINSDDNTWEGFKYSIYEESELACLRKLIEIVKNK